MIKVFSAKHTADFTAAKILILEYAKTLNIDLGFQGFDLEIEQLSEHYGPPHGVLLIVEAEDCIVGCAGIRKWAEDICELKRMYLQPKVRGQGLGKLLLNEAIYQAKILKYRSMRLDSLPLMTEAIALYRSFGFEEIPAYRPNPVPGAVFLEKQLD